MMIKNNISTNKSNISESYSPWGVQENSCLGFPKGVVIWCLQMRLPSLLRMTSNAVSTFCNKVLTPKETFNYTNYGCVSTYQYVQQFHIYYCYYSSTVRSSLQVFWPPVLAEGAQLGVGVQCSSLLLLLLLFIALVVLAIFRRV